jgi:hypothetical protein
MFEAAIFPAAAERGESLRPLDWQELAARLGAARDLRALVARPQGACSSFAARAQAGLPHAVEDAGGHREPAVNLDVLGAVNPYEAINAANRHKVGKGDQGTR